MLEKDITEKTLEAYNDVFADIINVFMFDGRRIIKETELTDARARSYYKADGKARIGIKNTLEQKASLLKIHVIGNCLP